MSVSSSTRRRRSSISSRSRRARRGAGVAGGGDPGRAARDAAAGTQGAGAAGSRLGPLQRRRRLGREVALVAGETGRLSETRLPLRGFVVGEELLVDPLDHF